MDLMTKDGWMVRGLKLRTSGICLLARNNTYYKEVGDQQNARRVQVHAYKPRWSRCKTNIRWQLKVLSKVRPHMYEVSLSLLNVVGDEKPCVGFRTARWHIALNLPKCKKKVRNAVKLEYKRYPFHDCSVTIIGNTGMGQNADLELPIEFRNRLIDYKQDSSISGNLCRLKNSSILYGYLKYDSGSPFQLPGQKITVKCIDSFGVNELNFAQEYDMTCGKQMRLLNCVKAPSANKEGVSSAPTDALSGDNQKHFLFRANFHDPFVFSTVFLGTFTLILTVIVSIASLKKFLSCYKIRPEVSLEEPTEIQLNNIEN